MDVEEQDVVLPTSDELIDSSPTQVHAEILQKLSAARRRQGLSVRCVAQRLGLTVREVRAGKRTRRFARIGTLSLAGRTGSAGRGTSRRAARYAIAARPDAGAIAQSDEDRDGYPATGPLRSGTASRPIADRAIARNDARIKRGRGLAGRRSSPPGRRSRPHRREPHPRRLAARSKLSESRVESLESRAGIERMERIPSGSGLSTLRP